MRAQAIPMSVYRRRIFLSQLKPRAVATLLALMAIWAAAVFQSAWPRTLPVSLLPQLMPPATAPCDGATAACALAGTAVPTLTDSVAVPWLPPAIGLGIVSVDNVGYVAYRNMEIAVSMVDGAIILPGERFTFDDTARTWDFREDERYLMGWGTSVYGLIPMRGGGVCWVSTALWRAALAAGLQTDYRENHYGMVDILGPGLDATNTLAIRNDSSTPITIRAWIDEEQVRVALFAEGPLGRTAEVRGPTALGNGRYALYQQVTWADGTETSTEFVSRYYW